METEKRLVIFLTAACALAAFSCRSASQEEPKPEAPLVSLTHTYTAGANETLAGEIAQELEGRDIGVDVTHQSVRLTIQNLHFKPDSPELLEGDEKRLDEIADTLLSMSGRRFLIEGHCADTGNPVGEQDLSEERAEVIAQALIERGVSAGSLVTGGSGARDPVADNSTEEGRIQNRRVEITILN